MAGRWQEDMPMHTELVRTRSVRRYLRQYLRGYLHCARSSNVQRSYRLTLTSCTTPRRVDSVSAILFHSPSPAHLRKAGLYA